MKAIPGPFGQSPGYVLRGQIQGREAFSKIKGLLRKAQARTKEALIEALGEAISAVTAEDVWGFFEHCGYRRMAQLL